MTITDTLGNDLFDRSAGYYSGETILDAAKLLSTT